MISCNRSSDIGRMVAKIPEMADMTPTVLVVFYQNKPIDR